MQLKLASLGFIGSLTSYLVSTAIGLRKYRIPSDLRSQAQCRSVSTMVGDHMGIPGVVVFAFLAQATEWEVARPVGQLGFELRTER